MKRLHSEAGGRPIFNNDLDTVQGEVLEALESTFKGSGAFIVNGCTVSSTNINAGIVFIDGKIMRFEGATVAAFPVYLKTTEELQENEAYETGGIKPTIKNIKAVVSTTVPTSVEYITITSSGGRAYYDVLGAEFLRLKGSQTISGAKKFTSKIDAPADVETTISSKKVSLGSLQSEKADKSYVDSYFIYRGSGGDTNNYIEDGYANGRPFSANHPSGASHGTLFIYGRSASGTRQIFMDDYSHIWTRAQRWDGAWSSWVKQWDDQNFDPDTKLNKSIYDSFLADVAYGRRGSIGGLTDWNTLTLAGCYKIQNYDAAANGAPPATYRYGLLTVDRATGDAEGRVVQTYVPHTTDKNIYVRMSNQGSWTGWKVYVDKSYVDTKATITTANSLQTQINANDTDITNLQNNKQDKFTAGWVSLNLLNGATAYSGFNTPSCMKDPFGFVHLRGTILHTNVPSGSDFASLPSSAYYPSQGEYRPIAYDSTIRVETTGGLQRTGGSVNAIHLSGISFYVG
jgi:hypothetical protein